MNPGETKFIGGKEITCCEFRIIQQVMKLLLRKQIASVLGKSLNTINAQMRMLFEKLDITKNTELIAWGQDNGFDRDGNYKPKAMVIPPVVVPTLPRTKSKAKKKKR